MKNGALRVVEKRMSVLKGDMHKKRTELESSALQMVGETGFEPATYCSQSNRATRLRYSPFEISRAVFAKPHQNATEIFIYLVSRVIPHFVGIGKI